MTTRRTVDSLTAPERETIINSNDADGIVRISTSQRTVITALRKKPHRFKEVDTGHHGATEWADFEIPVSDVNWGSLGKRVGSSRSNLRHLQSVPSMTGSTGEGGDARDRG